jgi:hypothetical protein
LISCDTIANKSKHSSLVFKKESVHFVKADHSMSCLFYEYSRTKNRHIWRMRGLKFGIFEKYTCTLYTHGVSPLYAD